MNAPATSSLDRSVPPGALDEAQPDYDYPNKLPDFGTITDDGNAHGQAMAYLNRIGQESKYDAEPYLEQARKNDAVYQWGQSHKPDDERVIANEIQTAILSITDIQTRDAFSIFIRPVQTRDIPQVFWLGPPVDANLAALVPGLPLGLGMEPVIDPMTGQPAMQAVPVTDPMTGAPTGQATAQPMMQPAQTRDKPLDQVTAWQVRKLLGTGAFPAEWLFTLDDKAMADVYQTVFDVFWKQDKLDEWLWEHQLKANVFGYQTYSYGWDPDKKCHVVRDMSIVQARLDPAAEGSSFHLQNDPGYEVVYDVDEAKARWPQLADLIESYAREGEPKRTDSYSEFGTASNRHFRRRTVTFLIHWFRNQPMPMTEEEAMAGGHVYHDGENFRSTQVQETPDAGMEKEGAAEDATEGAGDVEPGGNSGIPPQQVGAGNAPQVQSDNGHPGVSAAVPGANGIAPPVAPAWPTTTGIRQIATIAQTQRIVQDIRNEHWDIPMGLTPCISLPGKPYGQGLPEKLRGLQQADIQLLNAVIKYVKNLANPGCIIADSVAKALPGGGKRIFVDPSESYIAPDEMVMKWGDKVFNWYSPPPLAPAVPEVMGMIDARFKSTSGHPEVMQGVSPSPTSSGKMIEALQAGAAGQFGFQAKNTLRTVERVANLMHYTHVWRLSLDEMCEIYGRLPPELMQMVMDRAQQKRWDNTVDANGSMGGKQMQELNKVLALFQARNATGEPAASLRTVRDVAGLDDEEESLAYRSEMQMAPAPMPGQPMPGQPGEPSQPSSVNTQEPPQ